MIPPAVLPLAAILLVAGPAPAPAPDLVPRSNAENLATQLGHSIGAARQCAMGERADAALAKATQMVDQAAVEESMDSLDLNDRLHEAVSEGRDAVLDGTMTCDQAKEEIKRLEGERRY